MSDYALNRAAAALAAVLRARQPDLSWEVTIGPEDRPDREPVMPGARQVTRLVPRENDPHSLRDRQAPPPHPNHPQKAA